jgi:hypothetical protein
MTYCVRHENVNHKADEQQEIPDEKWGILTVKYRRWGKLLRSVK